MTIKFLIESFQEIIEDIQSSNEVLIAKLKIMIDEKAMEIEDLKSVVVTKEGMCAMFDCYQTILLDELQLLKQQQKFDEFIFKEKEGMRYYVINYSMLFVSKLQAKLYLYNNRVRERRRNKITKSDHCITYFTSRRTSICKSSRENDRYS